MSPLKAFVTTNLIFFFFFILFSFDGQNTDVRLLSNEFMTLTPNEVVTPEGDFFTFSWKNNTAARYFFLNEMYISMIFAVGKKLPNTTTWKCVDPTDNISMVPFLPDLLWKGK